MEATEFELQHQTLLRLLLVTLAFLTYLVQPDDVVWALVKDSAHNRLLERDLFAVATLLIGAGAGICTWARAHSATEFNLISGARSTEENRHDGYHGHIGNLLYSVGLGSLAPLSGFIILVVGQAFLSFRLIQRFKSHSWNIRSQQEQTTVHASVTTLASGTSPNWSLAIRHEAAKWGILVTMIVFTISLVDRVVEILAVASFLVWLFLNRTHFRHTS